MARILSIDYGRKRTGIAVTDPLQIIANGLTTVASSQLIDCLLYTARFSHAVYAARVGRTGRRGAATADE